MKVKIGYQICALEFEMEYLLASLVATAVRRAGFSVTHAPQLHTLIVLLLINAPSHVFSARLYLATALPLELCPPSLVKLQKARVSSGR